MSTTIESDITEPTTEVALRDGSKGTAAIRESIADKYPALAPTEEMLEVFQENLGGETISITDLQVIKVPSGELNSWVITQGGEDQSVKELQGVVISVRPRRSYWDGDGDPDGSVPDCASADNKTPQAGGLYAKDGERGAQNPRGICETCPMAQRGSGKNGSSACREQRLFFLMVTGAMFPRVVQVPRTSIKPARQYAMSLADSGLGYYAVETGLGLTKARNVEGTTYNTITFRSVSVLTKDERRAAKAYGQEIKDMIEKAVQDFAPVSDIPADDGFSVGDASTGTPFDDDFAGNGPVPE